MPRNLSSLVAALALALLPLATAAAPAENPAPEQPPVPAPPQAEEPAPAVPPPLAPPAPAEDNFQSEDQGNIFMTRRHDTVVFGRNVVIGENDEARDVFVFGADAIVRGTVHDLVVVSGTANVLGAVQGNLVTILGSAHLGPGASVRRDVTVVGGNLTTRPDSTIGGQRVELSLGSFGLGVPRLQAWARHGLLLGRPLPPNVQWVWWFAGAMFLLYVMMAGVFSKSVGICVEVLETRPAASFFTGLLMLMLIGPFILLLVISIIGILAIPFVFFGLIFAFFFGKVAVYRFTGQQLARQLHLPGLEMAIPACLIGIAVFYLFYTIPFVGFLLWGVATLLGMGAVFLAFNRLLAPAHRRAPAPVLSPPGSPLPGSPAPGMPAGSAPVMDPFPPLVPLSSAEALPRAGFWIRLAATLLDAVMIGALTIPFHFVGLTLLIWVAYHVGMWTWKGTTVGGIILGIKCVRTNGDKVSFPVALVRSLASFLSAIALFLGFLWAAWDREKQSWHDKIAGTIKIRVPRGLSLV